MKRGRKPKEPIISDSFKHIHCTTAEKYIGVLYDTLQYKIQQGKKAGIEVIKERIAYWEEQVKLKK